MIIAAIPLFFLLFTLIIAQFSFTAALVLLGLGLLLGGAWAASIAS